VLVGFVRHRDDVPAAKLQLTLLLKKKKKKFRLTANLKL
jgi:hypothetical protein